MMKMVEMSHDSYGSPSFHPTRLPVPRPTSPCSNLSSADMTFNGTSQVLCDILTEHKHRQILDRDWQILVIIGYALLIAAGVISNVLVCCVVARQAGLRSSHFGCRSRNLFILNLALADLVLCCVCMPITLHNLLNIHWTMGVFICKLAPVIQAANMLVSAGTVTAIAFDRYNTIVRYPRGRNQNAVDGESTWNALSGLIIMWLLSLLLTTPLFFFTQLESVHENGVHLYDICHEKWPSETMKLAYSAGLTTVQFVIPVCILSTIHFKISSYLKQHLRKFERPKITIDSPLDRNENHLKITTDDDTLIDEKRPLQKEFLNITRKESICSDNSQSSRKNSDCSDAKRYSTPDISPRKRKDFFSSFRENSDFSFSFSKLSRESSKKSTKSVRRELRRNRRTTLLLACIAFLYAVSWLPYHVYNILTHAAPFLADPATLYKAFAAAHLLAMTSVCVNPFLYGWLNTNFRREFHYIFSSMSFCLSKMFKKSSRIVKGGDTNKKNTRLSFVGGRRQSCVVVALYAEKVSPAEV